MLRQEDVSTSEAERYDETFALVKPFHSHDLSINSPYCLSFTAYNVSSENLVSNQIISPSWFFYFILITCLLDDVMILQGEITNWSLMGVKGLNSWCCANNKRRLRDMFLQWLQLFAYDLLNVSRLRI